MLCGNRIAAMFGVADAEMQTALKTEESLGNEKFRSKKKSFEATFWDFPPLRNKKRFIFHAKYELACKYYSGFDLTVKLFAR